MVYPPKKSLNGISSEKAGLTYCSHKKLVEYPLSKSLFSYSPQKAVLCSGESALAISKPVIQLVIIESDARASMAAMKSFRTFVFRCPADLDSKAYRVPTWSNQSTIVSSAREMQIDHPLLIYWVHSGFTTE
jgi:hypothetical protein